MYNVTNNELEEIYNKFKNLCTNIEEIQFDSGSRYLCVKNGENIELEIEYVKQKNSKDIIVVKNWDFNPTTLNELIFIHNYFVTNKITMEQVENQNENLRHVGFLDMSRRKERNEMRFNEFQKRRWILFNMFPDIDNSLESVKNEYYSAKELANFLFQGVSSSILGPVITFDKYFVDGINEEDYLRQFKRWSEAYSVNKKLIPYDKTFDVPKLDIDFLKYKIDFAQDLHDLISVLEFLKDLEEFQTLDNILVLKKLENEVESKILSLNYKKLY